MRRALLILSSGLVLASCGSSREPSPVITDQTNSLPPKVVVAGATAQPIRQGSSRKSAAGDYVFADLTVGAKVGSMTVSNVTRGADQGSGEVTFTGDVRVSGTFWDDRDVEGLYRGTCIMPVGNAVPMSGNHAAFCLKSGNATRVIPSGSNGTATVRITQLVRRHGGENQYDEAVVTEIADVVIEPETEQDCKNAGGRWNQQQRRSIRVNGAGETVEEWGVCTLPPKPAA